MTLRSLEGDRSARVLQRGEIGLELLAVLLGDQAGLDGRQGLAELHRRALHRPQDGDELVDGLGVALLERTPAAFVAAGDVGRAGAGVTDGLPGDEPAERRAADTRDVEISSLP